MPVTLNEKRQGRRGGGGQVDMSGSQDAVDRRSPRKMVVKAATMTLPDTAHHPVTSLSYTWTTLVTCPIICT